MNLRARTHCPAVAVAVAVAVVLTAGPAAAFDRHRASPASQRPGMSAMFEQPSYSRGRTAHLRVVADAGRITVQMLSAVPASADPDASLFDDPAVGPARTVAWRPGAGTVGVRIGLWSSGVYFVRVRSRQGQVLAPVVVRPARLGHASVAVVVPSFTWQAYNRRDDDSWYVCTCVRTIDLSRPYVGSGIPYNFAQYDRGMFAWLARNHEHVDVIADEDLNRIASGAELHRLYRLIVFEGHGEYVTRHMFDITQRYRDRGGHLAFLSANNFFREVVVSGNAMTLIGRWRDLGRPEAALIGSQYIDWDRNRYPDRQYVVVGETQVPWLFAGTGLADGSLIGGHFGIEIDGLAPSSPRGTVVVGEIPDIFPGETAQMTYYTTATGAEVFNAGTISFGGAAGIPDVSRMLLNLWAHMAGSPAAQATRCSPPRSRRHAAGLLRRGRGKRLRQKPQSHRLPQGRTDAGAATNRPDDLFLWRVGGLVVRLRHGGDLRGAAVYPEHVQVVAGSAGRDRRGAAVGRDDRGGLCGPVV